MEVDGIINRALDGHYKGSPLFEVNAFNLLKKDVHSQKDLLGHHGCVNSVELNRGEDMFSSGGDDLRVFLWNTSDVMTHENPAPRAIMKTEHLSNIFSLAFSNDDTTLFSGANDGLMFAHDISTGELVTKYDGKANAVHNICVNPIDNNMIAVTRENGTVTFYDRREDNKPSRTAMMINMPTDQFYSGQYNPSSCALFAVSSAKCGVTVLDLRAIERGDILSSRLSRCLPDGAIYAKWNSTGTGIGLLQTGKPPLFVDFSCNRWIRMQDPTYKNVHTIKSLEFIDDRTLITGSDNFNIYAWNIPEKGQAGCGSIPLRRGSRLRGSRSSKGAQNSVCSMPTEAVERADKVFKGHRSIVNHVRYSQRNRIMLSCGVEKIVKCWSTLSMPFSYDEPKTREIGCFRRLRNRESSTLWFHRQLRGIYHDDSSDEDEREEGGEGADDDTAEDQQMLNYFDELLLAAPDGTSRSRWGVMDRRNGVADIDEVGSGPELLELFLFNHADSGSSSSSSEDGDENEDIDLNLSSSSDENDSNGNAENDDGSRYSVRRKRRREESVEESGTEEPSSSVNNASERMDGEEANAEDSVREPLSEWPPPSP